MQCDRDKALNLIYGRLNDCLWDIHDNLPIDLLDEIRNLKLDLILMAMEDSNKNATLAAKMLNLNRTTMISMVQNELAPVLERRQNKKAVFTARVNSQE